MSEKRFLRFISNFVIVAVLVVLSAVAFFDIDGENVSVSAPITNVEQEDTVTIMFNMTNNGEYLLEIANILQKYEINATFFFNGKWMVNNANLLQILVKKGNEIGNQGFMNRNFSALSIGEIKGEITTANNVIKTVSDDTIKIFSPQNGIISENVLKACDDLGYKAVTWSLDSKKASQSDVSGVTNYLIENLSSGDIIRLFIEEDTLEILPKLIEFCQSKKIKIKKLSDCI